jgi:mono/diheme cytochrome c family protein
MVKNLQLTVLFLTAMIFASVSATSQGGKGDASVNKGHSLYTQYCVSCHGTEGKGDGPAASALKVRPPDLTTIGKRNNGFSQEKVMDQINGEKFVVGHGFREMPVWGKRFQESEGGVEKAASDVQALTKYLQSVQKK